MRRTISVIACVLMLALPASSDAVDARGRWLTYPTCTATTTTVRCTGRAVVANPQPIYGLGPLGAAIIGSLRFACPNPVFDLFWPFVENLRYQWVTGTLLQNGQTFTMSAARNQLYPGTLTAAAACPDTYIQVDPTWYDVSVVVGWGFGSATPITVLEAPFGTIARE
jgi:hypothetical protein